MFDLAQYLENRGRAVDRALDREMPPASERPQRLHEAMRYSVFSGGKRIRPILCLAAAESVGGGAENAIPPAMAVELLHTYTLIHDDLPAMDDDDLRRGKPTSHKVYGEAMAILAGDALQALAFETLARTSAPPPYPPGQFLAELAGAAGSRGVVGGQVEDIAVAARRPDAETMQFILLHKTADLFKAALRMGAFAGSASPADLTAATAYGVNLGLAFQITDDLLDAAATEETGAPDEMSCLMLYTPEQARTEAARLIRDATKAVARLREPGRDALVAIAEYVLSRSS